MAIHMPTTSLGSLPAFPSTDQRTCHADARHIIHQPGMTLRTYAAVQIMAGLYAEPQARRTAVEELAQVAINNADALLAELYKLPAQVCPRCEKAKAIAAELYPTFNKETVIEAANKFYQLFTQGDESCRQPKPDQSP